MLEYTSMDTPTSRAPLIIGIIAVAVVAIGAWLFFSRGGADGQPLGASAQVLRGEVTAVNLEEMMVDGPARITFKAEGGREYRIAVPSMGRNLCAAKDAITTPEVIAVGDLVEVSGETDESGFIVPCMEASDYLRVTGFVNDAELGIIFPYRKGPEGYVVEPVPANLSADADFVKGYMLTLESDHRELQNITEPREGPPVIQMRAYKNPERLWATLWPERHARESNIELALDEPAEAVVGGANAVKYTADGLYATDTYVVASGSYIYVFTGQYIDANSPQRADFEELVRSVVFTPEKG